MKLAQEGGSKGALGEAVAKKFNIPPGALSGRRATINVKGIPDPDWPGDRNIIIVDNFLSRTKKIGEIKVGESFDMDQFERYRFILENKHKLKKRLIDANIPKGQINGISYGLLPNADDILTVEKAAGAGKKVGDPVRKRASA